MKTRRFNWLFVVTFALLRRHTAASECPDPLFSCETNRAGKFIRICAIEEEPGRRWSAIQYKFGRIEAPEMVYPADPSRGAKSLFFSHEERTGNYHVSVRFWSGAFTYDVFSDSEGRAGVSVSDARGKEVSLVPCIEVPYMFPSYLQRALACDVKGSHGKAACGDKPYRAGP